MSPARKSFSRRVPAARAELWKTGRPPLTRLDIELTERCNNDCIHCSVNLPAGDDDARRREMTTGEIKEVLKAAASLGCLGVRFTGGEPLLRDDFEEIYIAARNLGLRVRIFTNATQVTPRLAMLFKRIPPLEEMEVSVYGMTAESAAAATGNPRAFEAARWGIGLLVEQDVPFIVKGAVLPSTVDEMDGFEAWAGNLPGMSGKPSYAVLFDLRSRRDHEAKNGRIGKLRVGPKDYVRLTSRWGEDYAAELRAYVVRSAGPCGDRLFHCLSNTASVDAYGRFQVCLSLRHPNTVYDLKAGSLSDAVTAFLPKVRETRAANPAYLERCSRCFLKQLCLQCPAKSWAEHGTLDTPVEYFCGITHAQAVSIGVLSEGETAWTITDWPARVERLASLRHNQRHARAGGPGRRGGEEPWKTR
jgi:radical SAM protein with 4Fe4S-binding SPASM domain